MENTVIAYEDQNWIYGGNAPVKIKGLTIGGFESAFFADLVAAYILENSTKLFADSNFYGIYHDDGLFVRDGKRSVEEMVDWLKKFQAKVDELTESKFLQFTMEIWDPNSPDDEIPSSTNVKINRSAAFPYLDMGLYWLNTSLEFYVYLKPNQLLKYLKKGSTHTAACFKAIPSGATRRLVSLTSLTEENANKQVDELYPKHFNALERANLTHAKSYPSLREALLLLQQQDEPPPSQRTNPRRNCSLG